MAIFFKDFKDLTSIFKDFKSLKSLKSLKIFKDFKDFKDFRDFKDFGMHLLNDLLISLSKSYKIAAPEAPQAFKIYGFAKGIHRFFYFPGCPNS